MTLRVRLRRAVLKLLGYYLTDTPEQRVIRVVGRSGISRITRESRVP